MIPPIPSAGPKRMVPIGRHMITGPSGARGGIDRTAAGALTHWHRSANRLHVPHEQNGRRATAAGLPGHLHLLDLRLDHGAGLLGDVLGRLQLELAARSDDNTGQATVDGRGGGEPAGPTDLERSAADQDGVQQEAVVVTAC